MVDDDDDDDDDNDAVDDRKGFMIMMMKWWESLIMMVMTVTTLALTTDGEYVDQLSSNVAVAGVADGDAADEDSDINKMLVMQRILNVYT